MELISQVVDIFLNLDLYIGGMIEKFGMISYLFLFLIVFCETGLVITPFLPGDSLLFAAGAFAGLDYLNIYLLMFLLILAAILGDTVNYHIGMFIGTKAFQNKNSKIFKQEYLEKTQRFYEKHGGKTIIFARFIPIIRTFAPFVAGVGHMNYWRFISYNAIGALAWVLLFTGAGYFFGNSPVVKENFTIVIFAIIFISFVPVLIEFIKNRKNKMQEE